MPDYTQPAEDVFLEEALNQRAVYWHPKSAGREGQKTYELPVEIVCRWDASVVEFLDRRTGNMSMSQAQVLCDRQLKELGVLWLPPKTEEELPEGGALMQLTVETEPFKNDKAFEIRRFDTIPSFDGDEFVYKAYL